MNCILVMFGVGWFEDQRGFQGVTPSVDPLGHLILTAEGGAIVAAFAPGVWTGFMTLNKDEGGNA